jgi:hypothetical protein
VRPNGEVRTDSLRPFSFGNAATDGVEECWRRIRTGWRDERIEAWAGSLRTGKDLAAADVVPYLDDEVRIGQTAMREPKLDDPRSAPLPAPAPLEEKAPEVDRREAGELISNVAGARRYRLAPVKVSIGGGTRIVRRIGDGRYLRLNASGGTVLDALAGGTSEEAASALVERFGVAPDRARDDVARAIRDLLQHGVIVPAGASHRKVPTMEPGTSDLPGEEPDGARAAAL